MNKEIIEKYNQIRDIPYSIPLSSKDKDFCCSGKNKMLKDYLESNGFKVRWRVCSFKWSKLGLPQNILALTEKDIDTHVYLEVLIKNNWTTVDATWDKGLRPIFKINDWDGESATDVAVPVEEVYSIDKSEQLMNKKNEEYSNQEKIFLKAVNNWLKKIRQG